jgi:crossover junction endodeoxyribonuclease RuvC
MSTNNTPQTILGIDCGTAITGWAILAIDPQKDRKNPRLIDYGIIETHKLSPEQERLVDLGDSVSQLIEEYKPHQLAIEDLFFFKNAKTVMKVSQARGVVIYQAAKHGLSYHSYTPLQIKLGVTGYGRAQKEQIQEMVARIFNLASKKLQDDAADAIAVGYIHALSL